MSKRDLFNRLYGALGVVIFALSIVGAKKIIDDIISGRSLDTSMRARDFNFGSPYDDEDDDIFGFKDEY